MAGVRPPGGPTATCSRRSAWLKGVTPSHPLRNRMATSPGTGRSSAASSALIGGDPFGAPQRFVTALYPPEAVTSQGARIRDLYTIVFLIAVVIFFVVEA